ncbi:hypothetical protein RVF83_08645 [Gordonia rubripertincta]|uniref:Uncharacterized protein n=3 Tax=Gordonia rubripertincta TaxID=36822 RepID=A0AAW6RBK6_GORRU|nr:hypothetical protein [Gordonia rubripertincta]MDG6781041.1 hypothetical protein [Gordonia rubripertincta]NKY62479.1 hypothetical protein [Gordonia rubripertincta]QMU23220.1 hypothetical protein H3V45_07855 [Gordonia rubripertincta]GAB86218.1 hypothetical protein GORBP_070_00220 [Gordonia rubripertincta NBRC 101908]
MGSSKSKNDDNSTVWAALIIIALGFLAIAWPYFLGTWLAVSVAGASNPSPARTATGWVLEGIWLTVLLSVVVWFWWDSEREKAEARRREIAEAETQAAKRQRMVDFGPEGFALYEEAEASVSAITESEAARTGWLGAPAEFDFQADLEAIADNLCRAHEIRRATTDASSIKNFSESDKRMLQDAQREIARLEKSVKRRVALIFKCAREASDIDRALREDRENVEMAKQREELRGRLSPMLYGAHKTPSETPSEAADVVTARATAFHELKALIDRHRIEGIGES